MTVHSKYFRKISTQKTRSYKTLSTQEQMDILVINKLSLEISRLFLAREQCIYGRTFQRD